jgi:hypothetical protein
MQSAILLLRFCTCKFQICKMMSKQTSKRAAAIVKKGVTFSPRYKDGQMADITLKELKAFVQMSKDEYAVVISEQQRRCWTVEIRTASGSHRLQTHRGAVKIWRSLETAIRFIQTQLGRCAEVSVVVGNWRFLYSASARKKNCT